MKAEKPIVQKIKGDKCTLIIVKLPETDLRSRTLREFYKKKS